MYSPLSSNGHRKMRLRLRTARMIVVVALIGLAASLGHTGLINFLPKAAAQASHTASPTPTPAQPVPYQAPLPVPTVAPGYEAEKATYPQLALIGVQFDRQQAMSLKEVVELALRNNKDIEIS